MKKILKGFLLTVLTLVLIAAIVGAAFLNFSPQFGGSASKEQQQQYATTGHYEDGVFINKEVIEMEINFQSIVAMMNEIMHPDPNVAPATNLEVEKVDPHSLQTHPDSLTRVTWLGHSSFLIEISGLKILIDPVFGQYAAPHPLISRPRFNKEMPITISELSNIDAVIISHDHYDHLDYPSISELKDKVGHFYVPLGVGNHLRRWEIAEEKISELDWWQETHFDELKIVCTPSRHMSGRGLTDQSATLWGSWIIKSPSTSIYFSGDGGYGSHFQEIGKKYGPFDLGLMECGQYNELWKDVHMMPEETVVAAQEVRARWVVPIHWGSFALATHSWTDPVERFVKAAKAEEVSIAIPKIGEPIQVSDSIRTREYAWWASEHLSLH